MGAQLAPDRLIARLAVRQAGVVSFSQLVRFGLSRRQIGRRVQAGRLHQLHRGVYAVGHPGVRSEGRRWAAVLAFGDDAFLSHDSAADAFGFRRSDSGLIHITVRGRGGHPRRAGVIIHRPHVLPADEVTTLQRLPITTPARTLLDLASAGLHDRALEHALDGAAHRRPRRLRRAAPAPRALPAPPWNPFPQSAGVPVGRSGRHAQPARTAGVRALRRSRTAAAAGEHRH
jgi:hypothetical protein